MAAAEAEMFVLFGEKEYQTTTTQIQMRFVLAL